MDTRNRNRLRIPLICFAVLVGLVALIQLALNIGFVSAKAHQLVDENFDGKVDWSSLRVSIVDDFPRLTVLAKGVDVAYPADSSLVNARIDKVKAVASVWTLLKGNTDVDLAVESGALNLSAEGSASELFSEDPHFKIDLTGTADLNGVREALSDSLGIASAEGILNIIASADILKSQMSRLNFKDADVAAMIDGDRLIVNIPKDSLDVRMHKPVIKAFSRPAGFGATADCDSIYLNLGRRTMVRVRQMHNDASVTRAEKNGKSVPRIELSTSNSRIFGRFGSHRINLKGTDISVALQRRPDFVAQHRPRVKRNFNGIPDYLSEKDFRQKDVSIDVDTSILKFVDDWSPSGHISVESGRFASTLLPLRTRLGALNVDFHEGDVNIDTLHVKCGSTDVSLHGEIRSLLRFIKHRGALALDMDLDSRHLNVNEVVTAFQHGKTDESPETAPSDEEYEGFVTDAYRDADLKILEVITPVVPANLKADVRTRIKSARVSKFSIRDFASRAQIGQRTVKISGLHACTNVGTLDADAFYATITKKKISAGLDAGINGISATKIMELMPSVEQLMPALKTFQGNLSCQLSVLTDLDTLMIPRMNTAKGLVRIQGQNLSMEADSKIQKYTKLLLFKNKKDISVDTMRVAASLSDNQVKVYPFLLNIDRYRLAIKGVQTLITDCDYHFSVLKSPIPFRFGLNIYGDVSKKVRFRLCKAQFTDENLPLFDSEMDKLHSEISLSIKNVLSSGVERACERGQKAVGRLESRSRELLLKASEELSDTDNSMINSMFNGKDSLKVNESYQNNELVK